MALDLAVVRVARHGPAAAHVAGAAQPELFEKISLQHSPALAPRPRPDVPTPPPAPSDTPPQPGERPLLPANFPAKSPASSARAGGAVRRAQGRPLLAAALLVDGENVPPAMAQKRAPGLQAAAPSGGKRVDWAGELSAGFVKPPGQRHGPPGRPQLPLGARAEGAGLASGSSGHIATGVAPPAGIPGPPPAPKGLASRVDRPANTAARSKGWSGQIISI